MAESKARLLAIQLASDFLRKGNFESVGSPMSERAIERIMPAATNIESPYYEAYGLSGLAIQSVGYAHGADEESVNVYVTRGSRRSLNEIPQEIDGVKVRAVNLGRPTVKPEASAATRTRGIVYDYHGKIACGSSCAPAGENYAGTFGALVSRNGAMMALSNNHVFAACNHVLVGQPILAPSAIDARPGIPAPRQFCQHAEIIELRSGTPTLVPLVRSDAAIGVITDANLVSSWQGDSVGGYDTPAQIAEPVAGMPVKKFGRTTGLTYGIIESLIPTPMALPYKSRHFVATVWFENIWTVRVHESSDAFALPGDSGSLVVAEDNSYAIGLLFASTNKGDYGFIAPIGTVLADLDLSLVDNYGL